ncbi:MAG: MipA/OmpV family protein [Verrucomicrobia bacterium]|nr:MipA/OmpV family protein [Verrucomicrobiota bacterium]MBU1734267.1 MipA/OmpV family protein [Verrucomicrobiota bacterium]MBU1855854.1 MipA/OmpV family protein [Verrucomicrobiota bacterium]
MHIFRVVLVLATAGLLTADSAAASLPVDPPNPDTPPMHAESAKAAQAFSVIADLGMYSAYVSRGQVNSDRPVIEPALTVKKHGVRLNVWGNLDLSDQVTGRRQFSEVDLTAAYDFPVPVIEASAGIIEYLYPNTPRPSTREVFLSVAWPNPIAEPELNAYYDFGDVQGAYFNMSLEHDFTFLKDRLHLTPGANSGWGSRSYNTYNFAWNVDNETTSDDFITSQDAGLVNGEAYVIAEYALTPSLILGGRALYAWLWNSDIEAGARQIYFDVKQWVFGGSLSYKF